MYALYLSQPRASLVVNGLINQLAMKWKPKHRGLLLIGSAKGKNVTTLKRKFNRIKNNNLVYLNPNIDDWDNLPRGGIIGIITLNSISPYKIQSEYVSNIIKPINNIPTNEWNIPRYSWELSNPYIITEVIPSRMSATLAHTSMEVDNKLKPYIEEYIKLYGASSLIRAANFTKYQYDDMSYNSLRYTK